MKIGITPSLYQHADYPEVREFLDVRWGQFLKHCGYFPVFLDMSYSVKEFTALGLEGVVLSGGNDLASLNNNSLSIKRDEFEKTVVAFCFTKKIPVLGVCRGFQFLLHYSGEQLSPVAGHVAVRHSLVLPKPDHPDYDLSVVNDVNSYHKYAVMKATRLWDTLAISQDGCIEAALWRGKKALGLMWHPEREAPFRDCDIKLVDDFFRRNT